MTTINVFLPDALKSFVDEQVATRSYGISSEYVRELIRTDQDRQKLRNMLLEGGASPPAREADKTYFSDLRKQVRQAATR
ncbi:MAG TPA: type II toxin-antitoxin system ParD family antitoxin [Rhizomicrobium sp.]